MPPLVRFAPSPTGYLHVGNVRTALVNWLFARKAGGRFLLRLDDTDKERSRAEFADALQVDLRWLGLEWDAFARQSDRMEAYENARQRLTQAGRLYPCYETQEELDVRRKLQAGRGLPPIYDRAALKLSEADKARLEAEGRVPHYRFRLEDKPIVWQDLVRGETRFQGQHMSDPVLIRADGVPLYTLASVVDDAEMGITHILRGEDHVSNTAVQAQIFEALGATPPAFGHLALLKTKEGELSKRVGGNDIRALREAGIEPMAVASLLARLGTSDPVEPFADMGALIAGFDIGRFGRAAANYDERDLQRINARLLCQLPYEAVKDGIAPADEPFWLAVRGNIKTSREARDWWRIVHGTLAAERLDPDYLAVAAGLLPPEPWNEMTWEGWTKDLAARTHRKGRDLFRPLRMALTGLEYGPELKVLLPLMNREVVLGRLNRQI